MEPIPAPILGTVLPATIRAIDGKIARLQLEGVDAEIPWPVALLPLGIGVGATVYLRALSPVALSDESEEVARRVLQQFLN